MTKATYIITIALLYEIHLVFSTLLTSKLDIGTNTGESYGFPIYYYANWIPTSLKILNTNI